MKLPALIVLCLGLFMVVIDTTITNVALPSIGLGLHADITWLQWIADAYTLSFACFLLVAGHLGDQVGAKKAFQFSLLLFTGASFLCGLSSSAWLLTLFRLLQGIAAAFILPSSLSLINSMYDSPKARAKAIGVWGGVGGIAAAAGPVLGAFLVYYFDWRAVFFVNIPIGLCCFYFVRKLIPNPAVATSTRPLELDIAGQVFSILCIAALAFSLIEAGRLGWDSSAVIIGFSLSILSAIGFIIVEKRIAKPMIPISFFKRSSFSSACSIGLLLNVGFYGELFILPLYFHNIRDYSILMTGLAILPLMAITAISSYFAGKVVSHLGCKWPMVIGLSSGTVGFALFFVALWNGASSYYDLILPLIIIGFGISFTMPAATVAAIKSLPEAKAGLASGTFNMSRQVGSLVGVAVFGGIITSASSFLLGMKLTLIIAAFIYCFGAFIIYFLGGKRNGEELPALD